MTAILPPPVPSLPDDLPTPADATRADGWTPARQRRFLETLAATGVIMLACESVRITARSAYNLRIRHDGAAFRLGWDAAILIARGTWDVGKMVNVEDLPARPFLDLLGRMGLPSRVIDAAGDHPI